MIKSGIPTIYVSDMNRSVTFYTETLGLKLRYQAGPEWAEIEAGGGLVLGLHGVGHGAQAGKQGSITIGFELDEPLDAAYATLKERGVQFHGPVQDTGHIRLATFGDPDGNPLYLQEAAKH